MFDVAAAASSIVLIPATGVIHGTPSIAIDGSEMQHSNVGGALTTKADWCQVSRMKCALRTCEWCLFYGVFICFFDLTIKPTAGVHIPGARSGERENYGNRDSLPYDHLTQPPGSGEISGLSLMCRASSLVQVCLRTKSLARRDSTAVMGYDLAYHPTILDLGQSRGDRDPDGASPSLVQDAPPRLWR